MSKDMYFLQINVKGCNLSSYKVYFHLKNGIALKNVLKIYK